MKLFESSSTGAEFSPCRRFRFALWRIWDESKPLVMFIGLNPSTANEDTNDPTIRRVISMAKSWGFGGVYMMNCFPLVSSNPEALNDWDKTPNNQFNWAINEQKLKEIGAKCDSVIFAWGNFPIVKETKCDRWISAMFPDAKALIINKDGSPRHPLYVPASVQPVKYRELTISKS